MTSTLAFADPDSGTDERLVQGESPWASALYVLLRFRRSVLATTILGALIGLGGGLMRPNSYTSTGTLLLRSGARENETAESAVAGRVSTSVRAQDPIANEIEILSHRDLLSRVVGTVGAARILDAYDPAAADDDGTSSLVRGLHGLQSWWFANRSDWISFSDGPEVRALKALTANLDLRAAGTSLIRVSYETHTPELAKEVTDAFLAAAEERHRQVFTNRTSLQFLTTWEEDARKAAKAANDALLEFKKEHKVYDPEVQRRAIMTEIARLEGQIASDAEVLRGHKSRCESLQAKLKSEEPLQDLATDSPPTHNPEYTALQEQIFSLRSQKLTLESKTQDKIEMRRGVEAIDELIADTERRLQRVPASIPGTRSRQTVKNPRFELLRTQLDDAELSIAALQAATDFRVAELAELRGRLENIVLLGARYETLNAQVARHEGDNRRFLESMRNTELLSLLDQHKLSNLQVLEAGDMALNKTGPNRGRWLLFGAAFGLMAGLGMAFVRQRIDGSVHRPQDLEPLGVEILGVIPALTPSVVRKLGDGTAMEDSWDESLRRQLNATWVSLVPACMPRDSRTTIAMVGDERSGVTTLAQCLAIRSARYLNLNVLLVEANYHHAALAVRMGLGQVPGLTDLLAGTASREDVIRPTKVPGLHIVHAGSDGASHPGMKVSHRPEQLLRSLGEGFQLVLLDIPSVVEHPEFRPLVWCADRAVLVFAAGRSTKAGARRLLHAVECHGKDVEGVVLNRWQSVQPFWMPKSLLQ